MSLQTRLHEHDCFVFFSLSLVLLRRPIAPIRPTMLLLLFFFFALKLL